MKVGMWNRHVRSPHFSEEKPRNKKFQIYFKFWLCPCFFMPGRCHVFLLFSRKAWFNSCQLPMGEILSLNWQCCREIRQCFEHARLGRFLSSNPLEIHSFPSARYWEILNMEALSLKVDFANANAGIYCLLPTWVDPRDIEGLCWRLPKVSVEVAMAPEDLRLKSRKY